MSDETAKHFEEQEKTATASPVGRSVSVTITLHPNGQIEFSLPTNKVLAYGLLGTAQEQLTKMNLIAELKQAQAARGGLEGLLKRINGGK